MKRVIFELTSNHSIFILKKITIVYYSKDLVLMLFVAFQNAC